MTQRNELSLNLGLANVPTTQNPELSVELQRVYNAIKAVARGLDVYTGATNEEQQFWDQTGTSRCSYGLNSRIYVEAGEAIAYGNLVGIKSDGLAWKAVDGSVLCTGFCTVAGGVLVGNMTEIQLFGIYITLPAATLTPGLRYYNSNTAGAIGVVANAPAWEQIIGFAISDTQLFFNPQLSHL